MSLCFNFFARMFGKIFNIFINNSTKTSSTMSFKFIMKVNTPFLRNWNCWTNVLLFWVSICPKDRLFCNYFSKKTQARGWHGASIPYRTLLSPGCPLPPVQFPATVTGKAVEGHPSTWALATGVGDSGGVVGFWLQPSSAVAAIWGVNQWIEDTNQLINL